MKIFKVYTDINGILSFHFTSAFNQLEARKRYEGVVGVVECKTSMTLNNIYHALLESKTFDGKLEEIEKIMCVLAESKQFEA